MRKTNKYVLTGDAGGIVPGSSGKMNAVAFSAVQPHRPEVLKAASNVLQAADYVLDDPKDLWT